MTKGLNKDLKLVPVGTTPDGGKIFKTNFWDVLATLTPPGMLVANDPDAYWGA